MSKFAYVIPEYKTGDSAFDAGIEHVLKALEEAVRQRNAWMRDFYSGADLGQVLEQAIKLEDETLLEILRGK